MPTETDTTEAEGTIAPGHAPASANQQVATLPGGGTTLPTDTLQEAVVVKPKRSRRNIILPVVILGLLGFGAVKGYDYFVSGRFIYSTNDAYIKADITTISAKVPGYLTAVPIIDNTPVHAGEVLARIDQGDYQLAVDAAQQKIDTQDATIARLKQQALAQTAAIAGAQSQAVAAQTQVVAAKAQLVNAEASFGRAATLLAKHFGSQQTLDQARMVRDSASAALAGAQASYKAAGSALTAAKANQQVMKAQVTEAIQARAELQIALDKARRDLSFTQVRAPLDGIVANTSVFKGQYVQPGQQLMAIVPLKTLYVEANFKETDLRAMKVGQKVDLTIDALGGKVVHGTVQSFAPGTGADFSLLPPDNATGNFTKIVQRVPVRIAFDGDIATSGKLMPGLSVVAAVHTRDPNTPRPSLMSAFGFTSHEK
ncbi:MAG: HlyD family secretion protein [Hyphomicrobiales bacterium]|nr:HlyD family secretion protein [Hyphomicrobiales bacterium]